MALMAFDYIDRCVEVMGGLRPELLSGAVVGHRLGTQGAEHDTFAVSGMDGAAPMAAKVVHRSLRLAVNSQRLLRELPVVSLLTEKLPELAEKVPAFMGQVVVGGPNAVLLTEDATEGGNYAIHSMPVSEEMRDKLKSVFCSAAENLYDVFDRRVLNGNLAFNVGGRERWLDFMPSPIPYDRLTEFGIDEHKAYTQRKLALLTVVAPAGSAFRVSIQP